MGFTAKYITQTNKPKPMYIVADENKLGYTIGKPSKKIARMVVMAVDYIKGGDPTLIDRETLAINFREATLEDEQKFKVRIFS